MNFTAQNILDSLSYITYDDLENITQYSNKNLEMLESEDYLDSEAKLHIKVSINGIKIAILHLNTLYPSIIIKIGQDVASLDLVLARIMHGNDTIYRQTLMNVIRIIWQVQLRMHLQKCLK